MTVVEEACLVIYYEQGRAKSNTTLRKRKQTTVYNGHKIYLLEDILGTGTSICAHTLFQKPGASMESRHCGQDKRIFFCPVHNASTPCSLQTFRIRCIDKKVWYIT